MSTGGSALDVMKNIPSVTVDMDGNVSLRNAPPQIFIDGRPTTLSPDQIPADQIASVEIITNPSAKLRRQWRRSWYPEYRIEEKQKDGI